MPSYGCCACVPQGSVMVLETCGRYSGTADPGCTVVNIFCGQCVAGSVSMRVQQLDVRCETKTKDNVFVSIVCSVQYQVIRESLFDAFYKLTDSRGQMTAYIFDVVRATVPKILLDDVFLTKDDIAKDVKDQLLKSMGEFGYQIIQTLVTDIDPAAKVKGAMNDINAAQRQRVAAVERAQAEKIAVVTAAEADAEAKYLAGLGIARQRQAIVNGLRESVERFNESVTDINSRQIMEMMMTTQYFDVMKDIGSNSKSNTLFLSHNPGAVADAVSQVRQGFLEAAESQNMSR